MGQLRALAVRLAFMTLIGTAACGDGKAPGSPSEGDYDDAEVPDERDSGDEPEEDAGAEPTDGGTPDASTQEGGAMDAGSDDGAVFDVDASDLSECEGNFLEFSAARSIGRPFAAGLSVNTVHLVLVVPSGGGSSSNNTAQGLRYVPFDTTGEARMPVDVANVGIDTYFRTRDPAIAVGESKVDLFYTSNSEGPYELFYKELTGTAPASRETTGNTRNEYALTAGAFGDSAAVVFSNEPISPSVPGAVSLKLPGQAAVELVAEATGYHAAQIAFSEVGASGERRAVAGFLSDLAAKPGLFALPVGANGGANGALVTLSTQIGGESAIDIARAKDGRGGIVYTEAPAGGIHQLRFRAIAEDGTIATSSRNLTTGNQDLRDISIAAYSHGFVVAYRRVGGLPGAAATVNLLFIDSDGNRSGTRLVRSSSLSGGGLKVLVANDGRFVVLWAETESVPNKPSEIALKVRAARLNCAL